MLAAVYARLSASATLGRGSVCAEVDFCWMGLEGSRRESDNGLPRVVLVGWLCFFLRMLLYLLPVSCTSLFICVRAPSDTSYFSVFMEASPSLLFA